MKITKKSDVLVPEVLADMISAKLPTANTLLKIFEVDTEHRENRQNHHKLASLPLGYKQHTNHHYQ